MAEHRRRSRFRGTIPRVCLVVGLLVTQSCDVFTSVNGVVLARKDQHPLEGVRVVLRKADGDEITSAFTRSDGRFHVGHVHGRSRRSR